MEEREYSTIPGSVPATRAALSHSTTQTNPTVKRGIPQKKTKVKKQPKEKAEDKDSQTDPKDNSTHALSVSNDIFTQIDNFDIYIYIYIYIYVTH